jgi:hypothetical protein
MAKMTATQVVDKMLEDFDFSGDEHRPSAGGPKDPWRQAGIKKLDFKAKDFLKHEPAAPEKKKLPVNFKAQKHAGRFNWKPEEKQ